MTPERKKSIETFLDSQRTAPNETLGPEADEYALIFEHVIKGISPVAEVMSLISPTAACGSFLIAGFLLGEKYANAKALENMISLHEPPVSL